MTKEDTYTIEHNGGTFEIRISPPASAGQMQSIVDAVNHNQIYALCAALGACWRGPGRPKAKIQALQHNFLRYGQAVFDELHAIGAGPDQWVDAASAAYLKCVEGLLGVEEVKALTDFTENQEG